jgi:hypothetical protein
VNERELDSKAVPLRGAAGALVPGSALGRPPGTARHAEVLGAASSPATRRKSTTRIVVVPRLQLISISGSAASINLSRHGLKWVTYPACRRKRAALRTAVYMLKQKLCFLRSAIGFIEKLIE